MKNCPCGKTKEYMNCCGVFISGNKLPETPEELMRSRYTAYTLANIAYIEDTMKEPASNNFDAEAAYLWASSMNWEKLEVLKSSISQSKGYVEFVAYFSDQKIKKILHEKSEFHKTNGRWFYVDKES